MYRYWEHVDDMFMLLAEVKNRFAIRKAHWWRITVLNFSSFVVVRVFVDHAQLNIAHSSSSLG